jgi:hypothetical protein
VVRTAKAKYLRDPAVREGERERLREYRRRVRDPASKEVVFRASVPAAATSTPMDGAARGGGDANARYDVAVDEMRAVDGGVPCWVCGRRARFVRFGPLRAWRRPRWIIRARAP